MRSSEHPRLLACTRVMLLTGLIGLSGLPLLAQTALRPKPPIFQPGYHVLDRSSLNWWLSRWGLIGPAENPPHTERESVPSQEDEEAEDTPSFEEAAIPPSDPGPVDEASPIQAAFLPPGAAGWTQIGSGIYSAVPGHHHEGGRIHTAAYAYDNAQGLTVLYLGAGNGGIWKAVSLGLSAVLVPISDNSPGASSVGAFLVHRQNSDAILLGTGEWHFPGGDGSGIYLTTNAGKTWARPHGSPHPQYFARLIADSSDSTGNTVIACGGEKPGVSGPHGIWRSTDFGVTWTAVYTQRSITDLVQHSTKPNIWYAAGYNVGLLRSTDGGQTWAPYGNEFPGTIERVSLALCKSAPSYLYALVEGDNSTLNGVYRSSNGGQTWTNIFAHNDAINSVDQAGHTCAIACSPRDPNVLLVGLAELAATNKATTLPADNPNGAINAAWNIDVDGGHNDYNQFVFQPDGQTVAVCSDGGIYMLSLNSSGNPISVDDRLNLLGLNAETVQNKRGDLSLAYSDPHVFIAAMQDLGTIRIDVSADPQITWRGGGDGFRGSIMPANSDVFTSVNSANAHSRHLTFDAGSDWVDLDCDFVKDNQVSLLIDPTPGLSIPNIYTFAEIFPNVTGVYYESLLDLCNWQLTGSAIEGYSANQLDASTNPNRCTLYLTMQGSNKLFVYDGTRGQLGNLPFYDRTPVIAGTDAKDAYVSADKSKLQPNTVYYTTGASRPSRALVSTDSGLHWTDVTGDLPATLSLYKLVGNPGYLVQMFVATSTGVYRTDNGGAHWYKWSSGLPRIPNIQDMILAYDNVSHPVLYLGTNGRGFWKRAISP